MFRFPDLTVAEEEEELIDTRDLAKMGKVFGKDSVKTSSIAKL